MDPAPTSFHSSNPNDGFSVFSASDDEEDLPEGTNSAALSAGSIDASEAIGSQGKRDFRNASWRTRDSIQRALHIWSSISDAFRRGTRSRASIIAAQPLVERLDGSEDETCAKREMSATIAGQVRAMLLSSWMNTLLIFVLAGIGTYLAGMSPLLVFTCNAIAIVPLSALLTDATERIAATAGDTVGALLNISFGNLVELILFIALANNQIYIVQASILGSILVNLLLILGSALLAGSIVDIDPIYNTVEAQLLACLLFVSVFVILMPTAFVYTVDSQNGDNGATLRMSRISALIVLLIYILYFAHEVRSRPANEAAITTQALDIESGQAMTGGPPSHRPPLHRQSASGSQTLPLRTIRFADEDDGNGTTSTTHKASDSTEMEMVDPMGAEGDVDFLAHRGRSSGDTWNANTRPSSYQPLGRSRRHTRSLSLSSSRGYHSRDSSMSGEGRHVRAFQLLRDNRANMDHFVHDQPQQHGSTGDRMASVVVLIITSVLMSMCAEFLVSTIDDVTHEGGGLSEPLIGLIILPIVGNIAEYVTVVTVVVRGKLDLAIAVAVGSSIQISLCVTPLTVMAGSVSELAHPQRRELKSEDEWFERGLDVCLLCDIWPMEDTMAVLSG
ncbi:hypothetical protein MRS44_013927 [Fusarium solani]|uniref:uncharacterized protein n=1 Tax=Fusarium solani TaxID=169388 RepID=UPI0032C4A019|nr:hypothetical protein MRS44_013927 [Fusarium solani]